MGLSHHFWKIPSPSVFALGRIHSFSSHLYLCARPNVGYTPCRHLWTEGCARAGLFQWDSSLHRYWYITAQMVRFDIGLLCATKLHLFDQNAIKQSFHKVLYNFKTTVFWFKIFDLFQWWQSCIITPVFSVTCFFRNKSNMLICCWINIIVLLSKLITVGLFSIFVETMILDPLCEIQAKVSEPNYEKININVWFLPLIPL